MIFRNIIFTLVAVILLMIIAACSSSKDIDPVRPAQAVIPPVGDNVINIYSSATGDIQIITPEHQYDIQLSWNEGLIITNNGETIYDFTLHQADKSWSAGIVESDMTTAPLNIPLSAGNNNFTVSFSESPWFVINNNIYHTDGYDDSHEIPPSDYEDGYVDNEVLFGFVDGTSDSERHRIIREYNLFLVGFNSKLGMHTGRIDDGRSPFNVVQELALEPSVKWPNVNGVVKVMAITNDPVWKDTWPDDYRWAMQRIEADRAWDVYKDGVENGVADATTTNVVLCIADTGTHPHDDFGLDDFEKWAAYTYSKTFMSTLGLPYDAYGHGTSVAGIAGAQGNNGFGLAGVSWDAYFLALKCLGDSGSGGFQGIGNSIAYIGDLAEEFPWLKFVANYSLGGWSSDNWCRLAAEQTNALPNTMLIAAAGNSGTEFVSYPAAYPDFYAVGASSINQVDGKDKEVANECPRGWGTNWGTQVDFCAPGSMYVTTTNVPWTIMYNNPDPECPVACPGWYCPNFGGTSAATPHVTGLVALLWDKNRDWTKQEIIQKIKDTCDEMSLPSNKIGKLGAGRINAYRALTE